MELIRILNKRHWKYKENRYSQLAFRNSTGGGISAIWRKCILQNERTVCEHIRYYYSKYSEPIVYWIFLTQDLPNNYKLKQEDNTTGDTCHFNIYGISNRQARKFFIEAQNKSKESFHICQKDNSDREFNSSDMLFSQFEKD